MAHEPQIEVEGYAFGVKRFQNGGIVIKTCVTPSWLDKQTNQWTDGETMYFDVAVPANSQRMQTIAGEIESYLRAGESVHVLCCGNLTETKGSQGGTFKRVFPRRFHVLGHKPKRAQQAGGGYATSAPAAAAPQQPQQQQPADDPWAQPADDYEF